MAARKNIEKEPSNEPNVEAKPAPAPVAKGPRNLTREYLESKLGKERARAMVKD